MEARHLWVLALAVAAAVMAIPAARGVWMDLPRGGEKCVSEQLRNNVVVLIDYNSLYGDQDELFNSTVTPSITVKVSSPHGKEIYHKEKVTYGQFAFTTTEAGYYVACFWEDVDHRSGKSVTVGVDWKTGIATKDWDSIAKKEKIDGLDLELRKLEDAVESIHEKLNHMMSKEMEMRDVSETTNARVVQYSAMSLGVCILVSVLQLWYLRRYFRKKKLV